METADIESRRERIAHILTYFPSIQRAGDVLGLSPSILVKATRQPTPDVDALNDVEVTLSRMDADFDRVESAVPLDHPFRVTLPSGRKVTGVVTRFFPKDGAPYAQLDVVGPNLFDSELSGEYAADDLRFEPLGTSTEA